MRLLVVDDHRELIEVLVEFIRRDESGIEVAGVAYDGRKAVDLAGELKPDVILLDLTLPQLDGVEAIRLIRDVTPENSILVFTGYADSSRLMAAIHAGANGIYLKGSGGYADLVKAIELTHRGVPCLPGSNLPHPEPSIRARSPAETLSVLTPAEVKVLELAHNGADNATICKTLGISPRTLANYRSRITAKLGTRDWLQSVLTYVKTAAKREGFPGNP